MKHTRLLLVCASALSLRPTLDAGAQLNYASAGDAAKGVVLREGNGILELTTTPCADDAHKRIVVFRSPYLKNRTSPISCGSKSYDQFVVQQE